MFTFHVFLAILLAVQAGYSYHQFIKMMATNRLGLAVLSCGVVLTAVLFSAVNLGLAVDVLEEARALEQQQRQVAEPEKGPRSP